MDTLNPRHLWGELKRRRVVRAALYYVAGAWVLAQAFDLLLDAFDASQYMRFVVVGLVAGLPVATVLAWKFDLTPAGIERTPSLPAAAADPPDDSIAVLPFANLSNEPENEYFSDGLAEEIRNQLARVEGLRVAARSSSFAFKGRHEDVRDIGRRLNVATILEGGVRKQADTVRIDVQLVSAVDGYQVWAETFERQVGDIFSCRPRWPAPSSRRCGRARLQPSGPRRRTGDAKLRGVQPLPARPPPFSQADRVGPAARDGLLPAGHRASIRRMRSPIRGSPMRTRSRAPAITAKSRSASRSPTRCRLRPRRWSWHRHWPRPTRRWG